MSAVLCQRLCSNHIPVATLHRCSRAAAIRAHSETSVATRFVHLEPQLMHSEMCGLGCVPHLLAEVCVHACVRAWVRRTYREEECSRAFSLAAHVFTARPNQRPSWFGQIQETSRHIPRIPTSPVSLLVHVLHARHLSSVLPLSCTSSNMFRCHKDVPLSQTQTLYNIPELLFELLRNWRVFFCCALILRGECTACTSVCVRFICLQDHLSIWVWCPETSLYCSVLLFKAISQLRVCSQWWWLCKQSFTWWGNTFLLVNSFLDTDGILVCVWLCVDGCDCHHQDTTKRMSVSAKKGMPCFSLCVCQKYARCVCIAAHYATILYWTKIKRLNMFRVLKYSTKHSHIRWIFKGRKPISKYW